jgi:hypothetical protein
MSDYYKSSFGDLRLWLSRISTSAGRDQVVHELSAGDDFVVDDRGQGLLRARCSVLFADMVEDSLSPIDRLRALRAAVDGKPRIFRHPIEGSFLARVGPFDYEINSDSTITAELELVQVAEVEAVSPAGAGGIPTSGEGAVDAAAESLTAELGELGLASTLPADASAAVDGWAASESPNPRDVLAETGSLTANLGELASKLEAGLATWAAFKATIQLAEAVRAAAEAHTAATATTFALRVGGAVALRALVASVYGGEDAEQRYAEVLLLNDLATPMLLEPGTELQMPALPPAARSG